MAKTSFDTATPGPTGINAFGFSPITGTVISQKLIQGEPDDIVVSMPDAVVHINNLRDGVAIANIGAGTAKAIENWWGCSGGPGASGCGSGSGVPSAPWLLGPFLPRRF